MPTASGPDLGTLLRDLPTLRDDPLGYFVNLDRKHGPIARLPFGPRRSLFLISDPNAIQHVLQDQARRYSKPTFQYTTLGLVTGQGLLTSDGATWLRHRRLMQPAFHREQLVGFAASMWAGAERLAATWAALPTGSSVDVEAAMLAVSLEIVGETFFSADLSRSAPALVAAVVTALDHVFARARDPLMPPLWVPTRPNQVFRAAVRARRRRRRAGRHPSSRGRATRPAPDAGRGLAGLDLALLRPAPRRSLVRARCLSSRALPARRVPALPLPAVRGRPAAVHRAGVCALGGHDPVGRARPTLSPRGADAGAPGHRAVGHPAAAWRIDISPAATSPRGRRGSSMRTTDGSALFT